MSKTVDLLGQQAEYYLNHTCKTIDKKLIHVPAGRPGYRTYSRSIIRS